MINEKRKEEILRILTDVDAQRLNPKEALIKIETLFAFLTDNKTDSEKKLHSEIEETLKSVEMQTWFQEFQTSI